MNAQSEYLAFRHELAAAFPPASREIQPEWQVAAIPRGIALTPASDFASASLKSGLSSRKFSPMKFDQISQQQGSGAALGRVHFQEKTDGAEYQIWFRHKSPIIAIQASGFREKNSAVSRQREILAEARRAAQRSPCPDERG